MGPSEAAASPSKSRAVQIGPYRVERETLGVGSRSKVKRGVAADGTAVAVKRIERRRLDGPGLDELANELAVLQQVVGVPHAVQVRYVHVDEARDMVYIVMDQYAKDLYTYISERQRLSEPECAHLFRQIGQCVATLHGRGICHRDIKLENILMDRTASTAVLADFGFATALGAAADGSVEKMTKFCGSPFTVSPEIVEHHPYCMQTDVWSLGVVLYAMATGRFPFNDKVPRRLFAKIAAGKFAVPPRASPGLVDLLQGMLTVDPAARLGMEDVMRHPWVLSS